MTNAATASSQRTAYLTIFLALFLLTVLEVGVAYVHGHRTAVMIALFSLAIVKAACVALFFMHLKSETRVLRLVVAIPMALPILYALVLISEGIWRRIG